MVKDKKKMAERILNHALGIIYLLTGEEYTIVKKNSPHSSIHHLIGEVPIKCDDVAVYFSMDEWEYIEGHKELYKDMMMKDHQNNKTSEITANRSADAVSITKEGDGERDKDIQQRASYSDPGTDENLGTVSSTEEGEEEIDEKDILRVVIKSEPYTGNINADIVINAEPAEDLCARSQIKAPEEEICDSISTCIYDENLEPALVSEEEEDEQEKDVQQVEIKSEPSEGHSFQTHALLNWNVLEAAAGSFEGHNTSISQKIQGEWKGISSKALASHGKGNFPSTSYYSEQIPSKGSKYKINDVAWKEMQTKKRNFSQNVIIKSEFPGPQEQPNAYEKLFGYQSGLHEHPHTNPDENPNTCNECGKTFAKKFNLIVHQRSHTGEKPFSCDECGKQFSSKSSLHVHEKTHTGEKPHRCSHCGKHFAHKYYLLIHERLHTGEKPHMCNICGKNFAKKSNLVVHERSHTGERPYSCNECGKQFAHKPHLIIHERAHTGEKPHRCDQCDKQFTYKSSLLAHQKKHTGEKLHRCSDCGKGFTKKSNLEVHMRCHTGEKPYSCNECGKHFAYKPQLLRHQKIHTNENAL
ncbi:uncharacterized protein O3C94_016714 [Discoglossus pictus]